MVEGEHIARWYRRAGQSTLPDILQVSDPLTGTNLVDIAAWCGGHPGRGVTSSPGVEDRELCFVDVHAPNGHRVITEGSRVGKSSDGDVFALGSTRGFRAL